MEFISAIHLWRQNGTVVTTPEQERHWFDSDSAACCLHVLSVSVWVLSSHAWADWQN